MEAHDICDSLAHETEGVRACVVLDLDTGFTLLSSRRAVVDAAEIRRVVRIACLVCQNKLLGRYAATLSPPRSAEGLIREAHVSMADAQVFMACLPNLPNALLICETDKTMNIGFGWIAVHRALERFAGVPPESLAAARLEPEPEPAPEREPQPRATSELEPQPTPAAEPHAVPLRDPVEAEPEPAARAPAVNAPAAQAPRRRSRQSPDPGPADTAQASRNVRGPRPGPAPAAAAEPAATPEPAAPEPVPTPEAPPRQARFGARAGFGARPPKDRRKR